LLSSAAADRFDRVAHPLFDFSRLSAAERVLLAEDLWDSVAENPDAVPLTDAQRAELDHRLQAHQRQPDGRPWRTVLAEAGERLRPGRPARKAGKKAGGRKKRGG
jgi:putative addiction module component (TIGR02574 family)